MFHLFLDVVASVVSRCLKNILGVAHVTLRMRSGGDVSGPPVWSSGVGDVRTARARMGM
jgi:hypothetical protein